MAKHAGAIMMSPLLVILVTACGSDATASTPAAPSTTATPSTLAAATSTTTMSTTTTSTTSLPMTTSTPATTPGRTPVDGTTTCTRTELSDETRGDLEIVYEHYSCVEEMSDPRVSGPSEYDIETIFLTQCDDNPAAPWAAELAVSNEGGTWRGTCTGALDYTTDPSGFPMNYGICTLTGEGGYTGLSYVLLGAGGNDGLVQAGWIEPAP